MTAFAEVVQYAKPQPSLMPDVDSTLSQVARWKFVITTDLTSGFYQIPLSKVSMKYCGIDCKDPLDSVSRCACVYSVCYGHVGVRDST